MGDSFDYVIIGGGTAGLVLANRLTEDSNVTVLVLEAGQNRNDDPKISVPGLATTLYDDPTYDWIVSTVPQPELYGKSVRHGRGKVLGGSSAINVLGLVFPSKTSMDTWAKLGNEGWDWAGIEPYLRKFNTYNPPSEKAAKELGVGYIEASNYGTSGPIHGSFPEFYGPLGGAWAEAFKELGYGPKGDPMSGEYSGGFNITSSINPKTWERSHAGNGYYTPVAGRPNLKLVTECMVQKLKLDKGSSGVTASGVHAIHEGKDVLYTAKKEVLLCAGAFQSPQLLELSGIGNPDVLQKNGIDTVVANKNVGENLQDHGMTGCCWEVADGVPTIDMIRDPKVVEAAMGAYMTAKAGPLTSSFHSFASMPLAEALVEPGRGDIIKLVEQHLSKAHNPESPAEASQYAMMRQIIENPQEPSAFVGSGPAQAHFDADTQKELFAISDPLNYMCVLVALSYPFSRGSVHIKSKSVDELPAVDPKYLSHPLDLEIMSRHMQWMQRVPKTKPLADFLKQGGATLPKNLDCSTIDAAKEHVRRNYVTYNHPCGTCAMMPEKLGGVVDDHLRVYGVSNLRVVDASIIPLIPKVNIQATVYALAEKGADIIKADNK